METKQAAASVDKVLENLESLVASQGGIIEVVERDEALLMLRYLPGVNKQYRESVPTHDQVRRWVGLSLRINAPQITRFEIL